MARCRSRMREFQGWGPPPLSGAELEQVVADLEEALDGWRGMPYAELGDAPAAVPERTRLEELRLVAVEDRITAELALGRHTAAAVALEKLTTQHPLRERFWALRAVALQRSGRQADALSTLRELREVLDRELALDPSPAVRDLETALLRQDPDLAWSAPAPGASELPSAADPEPAAETAVVVPPAGWPLVGREQEVAALVGALQQAADRVAGLRGPDRRAGHRQVPARRGDRGPGRGERRPGAARTVLAGRRRATAVAVACGPRRAGHRAAGTRTD